MSQQVQHIELGDLATIRPGYAFRGRIAPEKGGTLRVLQIGDLRLEAAETPEEPVRIRSTSPLQRKVLAPGDLLVPSRGDYRMAVVFEDEWPTVASNQLLSLRPKVNSVSSAYLCWALNQPAAQHALASESHGSNMSLLTAAGLGRLSIPVPSTSVQQQIVTLERIAAREALLMNQLIANRRAQLQGMVRQLLEPEASN